MIVKPIDLALMRECFDHLAVRGVPYVWGAKAAPGVDSSEITGLDCSGFFQFVMSKQGIAVPEGSYQQMEWCKAQRLELTTSYRHACCPPSQLWACFAIQEGSRPGHVWLVDDGETMECYGGHGVGSRRWNTAVLTRIFHAAFRLPLS